MGSNLRYSWAYLDGYYGGQGFANQKCPMGRNPSELGSEWNTLFILYHYNIQMLAMCKKNGLEGHKPVMEQQIKW